MDPLLVVWGAGLSLGAMYWWGQKLAAMAGSDGLTHSFSCLISAGLNNCPAAVSSNMGLDNWLASLLFYAGVAMFLYTIIFPKPRLPPASPY